jgi:PPIC-type PPIASE domain
MYRVQLRLVLCLVVAALCGTTYSQQSPNSASAGASSNNGSPDQRIVLKVGDKQYTQAEFDQLFVDYRKDNEGGPVLQRKDIANNFAGAIMLSQQATAQGLEKNPEIERKLEMNRIQILSNAEYEVLKDKAKPSMQEIESYYNAHLDDFDQVSIRRVFVYKQTPTTNGHGLPAADARARAEEIRKVLASGGDAKPLIKDTRDAIDAQPLTFGRDDLPPFMAQAFNMKVGEWSQLTETPDAVILFEVVSHERLSLSRATPTIERKLQGQKLREEMDAMKQKTGIWMDEQYFSGTVSAAKGASSTPSNGKGSQEKD